MSQSLSESGLLPATPASFRAAMGAFATGVAVITTEWQGARHGMTVNSLTSVSLEPCLLLVCLRQGSVTGSAIQASGAFAVNLLAADQEALARRFVGALGERFMGLPPSCCENGQPLLPGCVAQLSCRLHATHPGGDHDILVGEVASCTAPEGAPLVFHRGRFGRFLPEATVQG
ncbi:flavin reductase family protein [Roseomonas sp. E05]|uniref:flavin reductase family protein n=1 Tax=Roseomonas sp. E05 TaxID=3046310 RepID=UPI0024B9F9C9|nr:flavin reductase family protein [Roseomonas sp. E05]MDJ0387697.1 flavin reductase family protein [Roseomonas sp. E05]